MASSSQPSAALVCYSAGLIAAPALASWFLLRPGYSTQLRIAAFTWAALAFGLGLVRIILYQHGFW